MQEMNYLRNEIIKKYQNEKYEPVDLDSKLWILDGYEGILQDVPVYYDNRDGLYIRTDNFKLETDEDFVILSGVLQSYLEKIKNNKLIIYYYSLSWKTALNASAVFSCT